MSLSFSYFMDMYVCVNSFFFYNKFKIQEITAYNPKQFHKTSIAKKMLFNIFQFQYKNMNSSKQDYCI